METYFAKGTPPVTARECGVLIADDEPEIREVLDDGLRQEGFSVWLAANGEEALHLYRSHREAIDVVLLDVRMPRLDGPATLVAMQELRPQVRCCFMSGDLGYYTEERLRHFGARAVLKKPFQIREVAQLLRGVVETAAPGAARSAAGHETLCASRPTDGVQGRVLT